MMELEVNATASLEFIYPSLIDLAALTNPRKTDDNEYRRILEGAHRR